MQAKACGAHFLNGQYTNFRNFQLVHIVQPFFPWVRWKDVSHFHLLLVA